MSGVWNNTVEKGNNFKLTHYRIPTFSRRQHYRPLAQATSVVPDIETECHGHHTIPSTEGFPNYPFNPQSWKPPQPICGQQFARRAIFAIPVRTRQKIYFRFRETRKLQQFRDRWSRPCNE
jgi:hypothetical protein